jgi:hypothetical protein
MEAFGVFHSKVDVRNEEVDDIKKVASGDREQRHPALYGPPKT